MSNGDTLENYFVSPGLSLFSMYSSLSSLKVQLSGLPALSAPGGLSHSATGTVPGTSFSQSCSEASSVGWEAALALGCCSHPGNKPML